MNRKNSNKETVCRMTIDYVNGRVDIDSPLLGQTLSGGEGFKECYNNSAHAIAHILLNTNTELLKKLMGMSREELNTARLTSEAHRMGIDLDDPI